MPEIAIDGGGAAPPASGRDLAGLKSEPIGERIVQLDIAPEGRIAQTGAAVTTKLSIPYPHRLLRVEAKHADGNDADNTDALTWSFSRLIGNGLTLPITTYTASAASNFLVSYNEGRGLPMPQTMYVLSTNTTNGHRVYFRLIVEVI